MLVITLLATVFLAALVLYVFNLGRGVQSRIETQHAADAAATAGAGWVARSMNTVAMNNVAMARYLALVSVLDAMPRTVEYTLTDQQAMLEAVEDQLGRAQRGRDPWLYADLRMIRDELARQCDMLAPVSAQLNDSGFDMRRITFYRTPEGNPGQLWRAMHALEAFNEATLTSLGPIAQAAAVRGAEANLTGHDGAGRGTGVLVPDRPRIEWQRGQFNDLEGPVRTGLTRRAEQTALEADWHHYRGPFDALFGWRDVHEHIERASPPGSGVDVSDGFTSSWSEGAGSPPGRIISRDPINYSPFGMHQWMLRRFHGLNHRRHHSLYGSNALGWEGVLRFSGFGRHLNRLASIKLGYLWPGGPPRQVVEPRWVTSFSRARQIHHGDEDRIHEFRFIELIYTQRVTPLGDGPVELERWSIRIRPDLEPPGLSRRYPYVWRDEQMERVADEDVDGDGELEVVMQRRWHYFVFGGANVGREVSVRNPHNFADRAGLPAPARLDHQVIRPDDEATRAHRLTFLAVARQPRRAALWSGAFDRNQLQADQYALAQVRVFNNHSWDLWTQMWHAQLEPVEDVQRWAARMEGYEPCACGVGEDGTGSRDQIVAEVRRQLRGVSELESLMLKH
ncbi:MAG: pilus assembly protein TadG-related protein [Phycisphaeraceae bacterium]